jgi:hypothetical protein
MLPGKTRALKQSHLLSSRIKVGMEHDVPNFSERQVSFYTKYSSFVFRELKKASFLNFICWMLMMENIEEEIVDTVDIKIFPLQNKNGNGLAGNCNILRGKIRIYPKTMKFCKNFRKTFGRNFLFIFAKNRARAALIHELLHLKYTDDEKKVRELTKIYFQAYTKKQFITSSHAISIYKLVFGTPNH